MTKGFEVEYTVQSTDTYGSGAKLGRSEYEYVYECSSDSLKSRAQKLLSVVVSAACVFWWGFIMFACLQVWQETRNY